MIARILGGKFGVYIVGITALASFAAGFQVCQWRSGAAETVQVKSQIKETHAAIERVTREGRNVEQEISERRRDADRDVRQAYRSSELDRPAEPATACVWLAALEARSVTDCQLEPAGEVPGVRGSGGAAGEDS